LCFLGWAGEPPISFPESHPMLWQQAYAAWPWGPLHVCVVMHTWCWPCTAGARIFQNICPVHMASCTTPRQEAWHQSPSWNTSHQDRCSPWLGLGFHIVCVVAAALLLCLCHHRMQAVVRPGCSICVWQPFGCYLSLKRQHHSPVSADEKHRAVQLAFWKATCAVGAPCHLKSTVRSWCA
jgi:hypothetical protein